MYYMVVFLMVSSSLPLHLSSPSLINSRGKVIKYESEDKLMRLLRLASALSCLLICIAFVPERPIELASICQRHHPAVACEVW